jgi:hypothetical protein
MVSLSLVVRRRDEETPTRILLLDTRLALNERLARLVRPPLLKLAVLIVQAARRVEGMRELVCGDHAERSISKVARPVDNKLD